jgi:hypothetical protein
MSSASLYTIAFYELHFTAQVELSDAAQLRKVCERAHWFDEVVLTRMLAAQPNQRGEIGFQLFALDPLKNVWSGFWHRPGKHASFHLVKTRVR